MTTIDAFGNHHDGAGLFTHKHQPGAAFDLAPALVQQVEPPALTTESDDVVTSYGDYVSGHTRDWLAREVDAGRLPMAAVVDTDPRPHLDARAAVDRMTFAQRAGLYRDAGMTMRGSLSDVRDGDEIVATALVEQHYGPLCDECAGRMVAREDGGWAHVHADGTPNPEEDADHEAADTLYDDALDVARTEFVTFQDSTLAIDGYGAPWADVRTSVANFYDIPATTTIDYVPNLDERCRTCGTLISDDLGEGDDVHICGSCEADQR